MTFPGFADLFSISDPVASRPYRGEIDRGELAVDLSRAEASTDHPIIVSWAMGSPEPGDIVWTTYAAPLIVHTRVIDLLAHHKFTGWTTYPVEVHTKSDRLVPDYFGLSITGRCGRVDLSRSAIEIQEYPGGWIPHFRGHYFIPDTWDGSDLFMEAPDQLGRVSTWRMMTGTLKRALAKAKVKNILVRRLTDKRVNTSVYTIGQEHLLPPDYEQRLQAAYAEAGVPRPSWI